MKSGVFCVSLDTELMWGMHDSASAPTYTDHIINGRNVAIPGML